MQKVILGVLVILAAAGWAMAYVAHTKSQDIAGQLQASQGERAKLEKSLDDAKKDLQAQTASAGSAEEIDRRLKAAESRAGEMEAQTRRKQQELADIDKSIEARKLELAKLERELTEQAAAVSRAEGEVAAAKSEMNRLHAEVADLQNTVEQTRNKAAAVPPVPALADPTKAAENQPAATTTAALPKPTPEQQKDDPQSRAEKLFQIVDSNGDGAIDEFEFRLKSVRLLGALDQNDDGVVTIDETLLSPKQFALFDTNGDGRISSIEFVEAFKILDRDNKGSITLAEYLDFVESAAK